MKVPVTLRQARAGDLQDLIALWQAVFGDDEGFIRAFYEASGIERTIVAVADDRIIGMINCPEVELWSRTERYRGAYVYALAVNAQYRNAGIGSALLEAAESDQYLSEMPQFLLLIPASRSLFDYYAQKGYSREAFAPKADNIAVNTDHFDPLAPDSDELRDRYLAACAQEAARGAVFVKNRSVFALSMKGTICYAADDGYIALDKQGNVTELRPAFPDIGSRKALWKPLTDISDAVSPLISRFMED